MRPGDRITTADGREYELTARAKCGPLHGWFANPCRNGRANRDRERWIADEEIMGVLDKRGQYKMELEPC